MDDQQKEILSIAQEECAEVIQAISKIFRFGIDTEWKGETNRQHLEEEIGDLTALIFLMVEHGIVDNDQIARHGEEKINKLKKWSRISFNDDK